MSGESPDTHEPLPVRRPFVRSPLATPLEIASEDAAYPSTDAAHPEESFFADWRERLTRNLSRRSDGRWDPLTYAHARREQPDIGA